MNKQRPTIKNIIWKNLTNNQHINFEFRSICQVWFLAQAEASFQHVQGALLWIPKLSEQSKATCNATPKVLPSIEVQITWQINAASTNQWKQFPHKRLANCLKLASRRVKKKWTSSETWLKLWRICPPARSTSGMFFFHAKGMAQIQWWSFGFRHLAGANGRLRSFWFALPVAGECSNLDVATSILAKHLVFLDIFLDPWQILPCLAVIKDHPGATFTPSPQLPQRDLQRG